MSTVGKALVCNNGNIPVRVINSHGETLVQPGADVEIPMTCDENWRMNFGVSAEPQKDDLEAHLKDTPPLCETTQTVQDFETGVHTTDLR